MRIIRKYKIYKLTNTPLEGKDLELVTFLEGWFSDLKLLDRWKNKFAYNTYYIKNDHTFVIDYNNQNDVHVVWVRNFNLWKVLESKFLFDDEEIKILLEFFIKQFLPIFRDKDLIIAEGEGTTFIAYEIELKNELKLENESNKKIQNSETD